PTFDLIPFITCHSDEGGTISNAQFYVISHCNRNDKTCFLVFVVTDPRIREDDGSKNTVTN
ncbi:hypothetical protein, partial [Lutibacter sp. HS1-25]|uniref:hypothetical protein n=1 Tax=Lutibacter sp. HS1-25 TaxID=2485000 RepID=UPI00197C95A6